MEIQILKVLVCTVVAMVFGFIWYGPVFGCAWAKEVKMPLPSKDEKCSMPKKQLFLAFFQTFLTMVALNLLLQKTGYIASLYTTLCIASLLGVGIAATTIASGAIWRGDSVKFFLITSIHSILSLLLCATIMYYI